MTSGLAGVKARNQVVKMMTGEIVLPTETGAKIGSRSGLIECIKVGANDWTVWLDQYDGTNMEFSGTDEEVKTWVAECRKGGYDAITNVWEDKLRYQASIIHDLSSNFLLGAVSEGVFIGELKRLASLIVPNKCSCWNCLGMKDPYADDDNEVDGEKQT